MTPVGRKMSVSADSDTIEIMSEINYFSDTCILTIFQAKTSTFQSSIFYFLLTFALPKKICMFSWKLISSKVVSNWSGPSRQGLLTFTFQSLVNCMVKINLTFEIAGCPNVEQKLNKMQKMFC